MSLLCWLLTAAVYGGFLYLLHIRAVPVVVMRVWFTLHLLLAVIISWLSGLLLSLAETKLGLIDKNTSQALMRCVCATTLGSWLQVNSPHISVRVMPGSMPFSAIQEQHDLCLCHTSFFDTILYLWYVPYSYIYKAKTFAKASLRNLPLFGSVVARCGHFPVFFSEEKSSSFSVNKEKQAAVGVDVEDWLQHGGSLSFFPEGALNRRPEVLTDFRLGSFNTILQHKLPIYYCVTYGNSEVWHPSLTGLPGYPADIYVFMGKYEYDVEKENSLTLSNGLRKAMQERIDEMLELRSRSGYKPWWKLSKVES